jgi:hypothetical protein
MNIKNGKNFIIRLSQNFSIKMKNLSLLLYAAYPCTSFLFPHFWSPVLSLSRAFGKVLAPSLVLDFQLVIFL